MLDHFATGAKIDNEYNEMGESFSENRTWPPMALLKNLVTPAIRPTSGGLCTVSCGRRIRPFIPCDE